MRLPKLWRDGCKRKAAYSLADAGGRLRERAVTPSGTGRAERLDLAIELAQLRAAIWTALSGD